MNYCWVIAVNGIAIGIRESTELALRQARVRKTGNPKSVITLHYANAGARTFNDGTGLKTEIKACLSDETLIATVHG